MKKKTENVETLKEKLLSQKKKLIMGVSAFFLIVLVLTGFYVYTLKNESDARELEYEAYKYYFQQKFSKAGDLFIRAYEKKKNIIYLLNAGYAYYFAGDYQRAVQYLNKVADMKDETFSNLAKFKMAMIYLKDSDKTRALKLLKEISDGDSLVMKDVALFELAKMAEAENKQEAINYYEKIVNKLPFSPLTEIVKNKLQKLQKE